MRSTCGFAAGGEDEPATLRKLGKRGVRHSIHLPWLANCPSAEPFRAGLESLGLRSQPTRLAAGFSLGFREGDSRRSDRRPDRATPQVTRVIGAFDPYRLDPRGPPSVRALRTPAVWISPGIHVRESGATSSAHTATRHCPKRSVAPARRAELPRRRARPNLAQGSDASRSSR
jgi:hypothetical protein